MGRLQREAFEWWDPFDGGGSGPSPIRSSRDGRAGSGAHPGICPFCGSQASLRGGRAALAADDAPADTFVLDLRCENTRCGIDDFTISASQPRPKPEIRAVPDAPDRLAA